MVTLKTGDEFRIGQKVWVIDRYNGGKEIPAVIDDLSMMGDNFYYVLYKDGSQTEAVEHADDLKRRK